MYQLGSIEIEMHDSIPPASPASSSSLKIASTVVGVSKHSRSPRCSGMFFFSRITRDIASRRNANQRPSASLEETSRASWDKETNLGSSRYQLGQCTKTSNHQKRLRVKGDNVDNYRPTVCVFWCYVRLYYGMVGKCGRMKAKLPSWVHVRTFVTKMQIHHAILLLQRKTSEWQKGCTGQSTGDSQFIPKIEGENSTVKLAEKQLSGGKKLIFCLGAEVHQASILPSNDNFASAVDGQLAPVACCHAIMRENYSLILNLKHQDTFTDCNVL